MAVLTSFQGAVTADDGATLTSAVEDIPRQNSRTEMPVRRGGRAQGREDARTSPSGCQNRARHVLLGRQANGKAAMSPHLSETNRRHNAFIGIVNLTESRRASGPHSLRGAQSHRRAKGLPRTDRNDRRSIPPPLSRQ